jgi:quinol monooxygenase YgiN
MIYVIATIDVAPGHRDEFLAAFKANVPHVLAEEGCLEYAPAVDLETTLSGQHERRENAVVAIEKWESVAALESHLIAPHMIAFRAQVKAWVLKVQLQILEPA